MQTPETDKLLLKGLAEESRESVEEIYKSHFQLIKSMVINNSGNDDDAADVFQEGMIVLFEKAKSSEFELNCQLKTYLFSVCRRIWLKKLQQSKRYYHTDHVEDTVSVEEDLEHHENHQHHFDLMEDAMNKIGEPCKSLLEAFYIEKKQMQEIATEFGYTNADNAKTQKYKCLVRLKKLFFSQYKNG